ncbi:MAG: SO_0444 family Cu/Zn efflux transporter, partial [Planctomycetota bacterium]
SRFFEAFGAILGDAGLWLLLGFGVAGLLHEFVPQHWLAKQLGTKGTGSVVKGALIGAPLPLCSCSVIPAASELRKQGASKGAATAFAVSTPEIDVPAFSLTWALLGPVMAVARVMGAAMSAITAGLLVDAFTAKDDRPLPVAGDTAGCACASKATETGQANSHEHGHADGLNLAQAEKRPLTARLVGAVRYGFVDMPADLALWLIVGLLLSAVVGAFLPASLLAGDMGDGALAILAAMGLGLVIYVCATGSTPLVAILVAKGLGPGPALAFLLAGPATNPAAMAWVLKDLGRTALIAYVASISVVAFLCGWGLQWLATGGGWTPTAEPLTEHAGGSAIGGAILAALLTYATVQPWLYKLLLDKEEAPATSCCSHATTEAEATTCCSSSPAAAASAATD